MATPEERLALLEQQLAVMTQQNRELADAVRQAQANGPGPARAAPPNGLGVDTRLLGKPPNFDGAEAKWTDWSVVTRAYCAITHPQLGALMAQVESTAVDIPLGGLDGANADACRQLYYILLMLCQGTALNIIVNAGELQGCVAWRRLHQRYEPKATTRFAGQTLELLSWSFDGDLQGRLELFERHLARFENDPKEKMSDPVKIGIVLRQLTEGPLKQHLLAQPGRLQLWPDFRDEIVNIRRRRHPCKCPWTSAPSTKAARVARAPPLALSAGRAARPDTVPAIAAAAEERAAEEEAGGAARAKARERAAETEAPRCARTATGRGTPWPTAGRRQVLALPQAGGTPWPTAGRRQEARRAAGA